MADAPDNSLATVAPDAGAAQAQADLAPGAADRGTGRRKALEEILAELRDDESPQASREEQVRPAPAPEPPEDSTPGPVGEEQDEAARTVAGLPAGEGSHLHFARGGEVPNENVTAPAPLPRTARPASQAPTPRAPMPRTLILLHALLLVTFVAGIWFLYHCVTRAVAELARGRAAQGVGPASQPDPAPGPAPKPREPEPVVRIDPGLQYVQEMERADVLFEKGKLEAAAACYRRALSVMPPNWNDGAGAFRLGECYFSLADYPRAIAAYERVALAFPSEFQPRALFQLGEAHLRLKAFAKAREAFYSLLLRQGRYGPEAASWIERAHYRVADCYWLEAEDLAGPRRNSDAKATKRDTN